MTYCNKPNSRTMLISVYQNILKLPYTFTNTIADNIIHIYFFYTSKSINKDIYIYIYWIWYKDGEWWVCRSWVSVRNFRDGL